jgi:hypothetical protein
MTKGYGLDGQGMGVRSLTGAKHFSLLHGVQTGSGAHPASYPTGAGALSLGVKRPEREADYLPPSSAEVNGGAVPPLPHTSSWRGA